MSSLRNPHRRCRSRRQRTTITKTLQPRLYDGDGNRVAKTVARVTTFYLVDINNLTGYAQVVQKLRSGLGVLKSYTYGHDSISQSGVDGTAFFYFPLFFRLFNSHARVKWRRD